MSRDLVHRGGYLPLFAGSEVVRRSGALTQFPADNLLGNLPAPVEEALFWDVFTPESQNGYVRDRTALAGEWDYFSRENWDYFGITGYHSSGDNYAKFDGSFALAYSQDLESDGILRLRVGWQQINRPAYNEMHLGLSTRGPYGGAPPYVGVVMIHRTGGDVTVDAYAQDGTITPLWVGTWGDIPPNSVVEFVSAYTHSEVWVNGVRKGAADHDNLFTGSDGPRRRKAFIRPHYYGGDTSLQITDIKVIEE